MNDIDWDKAPEGTTHLLYGTWRKIERDKVSYWDHRKKLWVEHDGVAADWFFNTFVGHIFAKPQPALPRGLKWEDAPEDATHLIASTQYEKEIFWLKVIGGEYQWQHINQGEKEVWLGPQPYHNQYDKPGWEIYSRVAGAAKAQPKEQPPVKKPIGWWS